MKFIPSGDILGTTESWEKRITAFLVAGLLGLGFWIIQGAWAAPSEHIKAVDAKVAILDKQLAYDEGRNAVRDEDITRRLNEVNERLIRIETYLQERRR